MDFARPTIDKFGKLVRANPLLVAFLLVALTTRLTFWSYTHRIWEDALITLTAARNAWHGHGLTHHASEPRIQSFTSPISVLIPLIGESISKGLLALRLASLFGGLAAIYYAYRIGLQLKFHWIGQVLLLTYLAADQLQIFFGMAGMETQVATAIMLANAYYLLTEQWRRLGLAAGLGLLVRPEFVFWLPILGAYLLFAHRRRFLDVVAIFSFVTVPWAVFAFLYYGSVIPNTIVAKTWSGRIGLFTAPWDQIWNYTASWWKSLAPFREWWFAYEAPLPDWLLRAIVDIIAVLALLGLIRALAKRNWALVALGVFLIVFAGYRTASVINTYYMWYLPPFVTLLFLLAAFGLTWVAQIWAPGAIAVGAAIAIAYGMHIPFTFPVDRTVQKEIEWTVRWRTGVALNRMMGDRDAVFLEPLGYMGFAALNKTTYDFPGLSSKIVVATIRKLQAVRFGGVIEQLQPSFLVLRPSELQELRERFPKTAQNYIRVARIRGRPDLKLEQWSYKCYVTDNDFSIFQRITPRTELGPLPEVGEN